MTCAMEEGRPGGGSTGVGTRRPLRAAVALVTALEARASPRRIVVARSPTRPMAAPLIALGPVRLTIGVSPTRSEDRPATTPHRTRLVGPLGGTVTNLRDAGNLGGAATSPGGSPLVSAGAHHAPMDLFSSCWCQQHWKHIGTKRPDCTYRGMAPPGLRGLLLGYGPRHIWLVVVVLALGI